MPDHPRLLFPIAIAVCSALLAPSSSSPLTCGVTSCGETGWRDPKCDFCDCCPSCWSCTELLASAYNCTVRAGLRATEIIVNKGTVKQGDDVLWDLHADAAAEARAVGLPSDGWLQCYAWPALLGTGLDFLDNGTLRGTVHGVSGRKSVEFFAVNAKGWSSVSTVFTLRVHFSVDGGEFSEAATGSPNRMTDARMHADAAYGAYVQWEKNSQSIRETVQQMKLYLDRLLKLLIKSPTSEDGIAWSWLGGLHMNIHKLMENVLYECELYLGQALLFASDSSVIAMTNANLDGCFKKRMLEAAKFTMFEGLRLVVDSRWEQATRLLQKSAELKDGWGWGLNVGEPYVALGCNQLIQAALLAESKGDPDMDTTLVIKATANLQLAHERHPEYRMTQVAVRIAQQLNYTMSSNQRKPMSLTVPQLRKELEDEFKLWAADVLHHTQPGYRPAPVSGLPWLSPKALMATDHDDEL